jgi:gliding motility-associated-like protein
MVTASTIKQGPCPLKADSSLLKINPLPKSDFDCYNCDGCVPVHATFAARNTGGDGSQFKWINGADGSAMSTDSSFIGNFNSWGKYPVRLQVTTKAGCSTVSPPHDVLVHAFPIPAFEPDPPVTTIAKPYFNFNNQSHTPDNSGMSYIWTLGSIPGSNPPVARYSNEENPRDIAFDADTSSQNNKTVWLKVTTEFGCVDSTSRQITINPDITVFVPNAFYPSSTVPCPHTEDPDCNTVFKVAADGYMTIEIFVFNRWGQQMFYTNDSRKGWDGTFGKVECPQDVYIYQINATSFNGKKYTYSGSITLLR